LGYPPLAFGLTAVFQFMKISVVHATRRPKQALEMRDLWLAQAANPANIEWVFGIDDDDLPSRQILTAYPHNISAAGGGCCRAYNETAAKTDGQLIVCASDDVHPIPNWDAVIVERLGDVFSPLVLSVSDGKRTDRLVPIQILTRAWFNRYGYIFPPQFKSMYGDVWLIERAWRDGCMINANDLVFEHKHPFFGTAEMDEVYANENAADRYSDGERIKDELLEHLPISLCMIVGNEEAVIERCLESAKGIIDELCVVRALGTTEPDRTIEIASQWATRNRIPFYSGEYKNTEPFPHVDNFAAARNLSYSLATKFWTMWLDADDTLTEINCKRIREVAKGARFDGYYFLYKMPNGGEYQRERLIQRGKGVWRNAVHEVCKVQGDSCKVPQVEVHHTPPPKKEKSSATRNLNILQGEVESIPRNWYYYHEELFLLNKVQEATTAGVAALKILPDSMPDERYEVCLNLSTLDPERARTWIFQAIQINPIRREAYAYLSLWALSEGHTTDAVIFFSQMDVIPVPDPKPWTHRASWYGWARNYLLIKLLRAKGRNSEADAQHEVFMKDPEYVAGVANCLQREKELQ
jgi:hypothetical protein